MGNLIYEDDNYYFRNCFIADGQMYYDGYTVEKCKDIVDAVRKYTYSLSCEECVDLYNDISEID